MKKTFIFLAIISLFYSCSEDFLDEKPEDFLSSANAYTTYEDFLASVNNLYFLVRRQYYDRDQNVPFHFIYGTELVYDGEMWEGRFSRMEQALQPNSWIPETHWNLLYKTISEANAVIDRSATSEMTDAEKKDILSQARFFRAFSYRALSSLFGGVPLVTNEITSPKTDFTRASKEEVLNQMVEDFTFASQNLPGVGNAQNGRINNLVAYHYLAETYISLGKNTDAITAASVVINDPNTALMQSRFGTRSTETPGDVFWDLFRRGNQNRSSGNKEALWVIQFELDVIGGGLQSGSNAGSYTAERHFAPLLRFPPFNTWPVSDYTGGRGIGWGITTPYYTNTIWGNNTSNPDFVSDIRNANHNFVRIYDKTNSEALKALNSDEVFSTEVLPRRREFYAYPTKITTPYNHPEGLYRTGSIPFALSSNGGATYTDQYMLRLSETYLIRAEAYLANNQPDMAAEDVNEVRNRAKTTTLATAGTIDIDYILDERARELGLEEKRRITLMRLGLLYNRVERYNQYYMDQGMQQHFNLWPIPAAEIEGNRDAILEQNPGY